MSHWRRTLEQTRRSTFGRISSLFGDTDLTPEFWDALEGALIQADLGVEATQHLLRELRSYARTNGVNRSAQLHARLRANLIELLDQPGLPPLPPPPAVHFVVGVNGSGKTTSAAKLARYRLTRGGRLLAPAPLFLPGARFP